MTKEIDRYTYRLMWSEEDQEHAVMSQSSCCMDTVYALISMS